MSNLPIIENKINIAIVLIITYALVICFAHLYAPAMNVPFIHIVNDLNRYFDHVYDERYT